MFSIVDIYNCMINRNKLVVYLSPIAALGLRWHLLYSHSNLDHFDDMFVIYYLQNNIIKFNYFYYIIWIRLTWFSRLCIYISFWTYVSHTKYKCQETQIKITTSHFLEIKNVVFSLPTLSKSANTKIIIC